MAYPKVEDPVGIIDRAIQEIRDESQQYSVTLMAHLSGQQTMGDGQFEWNRGMLTRCTTEIKILKKVRREMLGLGAPGDTGPARCYIWHHIKTQ